MGTNPPRPPGARSTGPAEPLHGELAAGAGTALDRPAATVLAGEPARHGWRGRLHDRLDAIRAKPSGHFILKIVIGVVGFLVVAVGIALIPLPGPGWALVILGLAIWAVEFAWARHMLHFTRRNVRNWTKWVGRQSLMVRMALGAVGLVFVSLVVWTSLKVSMGIDVVDTVRSYLATR